ATTARPTRACCSSPGRPTRPTASSRCSASSRAATASAASCGTSPARSSRSPAAPGTRTTTWDGRSWSPERRGDRPGPVRAFAGAGPARCGRPGSARTAPRRRGTPVPDLGAGGSGEAHEELFELGSVDFGLLGVRALHEALLQAGGDDLEAGAVEGTGDRGELSDHLFAVALVLDHLDDAAQLALRAAQADDGVGQRIRLEFHVTPPYTRQGIRPDQEPNGARMPPAYPPGYLPCVRHLG